MKKIRKIAVAVVALAMVLQFVPIMGIGGVVAVDAAENSVVLTPFGDTQIFPWVGDTVGNDTAQLSGQFQTPFFIKFDAGAYMGDVARIERAVVRLHVDFRSPGNPTENNLALYNDPWFFPQIGFFLYDPWPANDSLWDAYELTWNSFAAGTGNVNNLGAAANAGNMSTLYGTSRTHLVSRSSGSYINAFMLNRFSRGWHEIDVTDYVRASLLAEGERDMNSVTGSGWGRDGVVNIGFAKTLTGAGAAQVGFSSSRHEAGTGPQLVIDFATEDVTEAQYIVAIDDAVVEVIGMVGNVTPVEQEEMLTIRRHGGTYATNVAEAFLKFDTNAFDVPDGYELYDLRLRLTPLGWSGLDIQIQPRIVGATVVRNNWTGSNMVFADRENIFDAEPLAPRIIASVANPQQHAPGTSPTPIYMDVTQAWNEIPADGYLSLMLQHWGQGQGGGGWLMDNAWMTVASLRHTQEDWHPRLYARFIPIVEDLDGFDRLTVEVGTTQTSVTVHGFNESTETFTGNVILAIFDGQGRLVRASTAASAPVVMGPEAGDFSQIVTFNVVPEAGQEAQAFLWNTVGGMIPLI